MKKTELNVLIVEDDIAQRTALCEYFQRSGFNSIAAGKADEALAICKVKAIHVALIDCMLPVMNGVDLAVEMRKLSFTDGPIILMSGIFTDKAFESEALAKTSALAFLKKPFSLNSITDLIKGELAHLLGQSKTGLNVLVSKKYSSAREGQKVIEQLEEVAGYDLPFVLSILLASGAKGNLNLATSKGEIFGVQLCGEKILRVDREGDVERFQNRLVQEGYLEQSELTDFSSTQRYSDFIENLEAKNLLSPHVGPDLREKQMKEDLVDIFKIYELRLSFVPDRKLLNQSYGITLEGLGDFLLSGALSEISFDYLQVFFGDWFDFPIRTSERFDESSRIFKKPPLNQIPELPDLMKSGATIEELIQAHPELTHDVLRSVYLLTLRRYIVFDDLQKIKSAEDRITRVRNLITYLKGQDFFEIFEYLGASSDAKAEEVQRIYKDFAKTYHPDLFSTGVDKESQKEVNELFQTVTRAHQTLVDEKLRTQYIAEQQSLKAKQEMRAEALADEAILSLKRGRFADANDLVEEAYRLNESSLTRLVRAWAILKSTRAKDPEAMKEIEDQLKLMSLDERENYLYHFVRGLHFVQLNMRKEGYQCFVKSLELNGDFLDSRRELSSLKSFRKEENTPSSILTADLGQVVSNFFKKKSK